MYTQRPQKFPGYTLSLGFNVVKIKDIDPSIPWFLDKAVISGKP